VITRKQELIDRIYTLDPIEQPQDVAAATTLLAEIKEHERQADVLGRRLDVILSPTTSMEIENLGDLIERVLNGYGEPLRPVQIAAEIRAIGFTHAGPTKNPKQLENSVWARLSNDDRFVRTRRGLWDLADREAEPAGYTIEIRTAPYAALRGSSDEADQIVRMINQSTQIADDAECDPETGVITVSFRYPGWDDAEEVEEDAKGVVIAAMRMWNVHQADDGTYDAVYGEPQRIRD
jgi:hypothetical protein